MADAREGRVAAGGGRGEGRCGSAEFFGIGDGGISHRIKDAVCGRVVDVGRAVVRVARDGRRCYFCSRACLVLYYLNPLSYLR